MKTLLALISLILAASTFAPPAFAQDALTNTQKLYTDFAQALDTDDVQAIQALYAEGVVFVPAPGVVLTKDEDIAGALGQFTAMSDKFEVKVRSVYEHGDTLLAIADWTIVGKAADGSPMTLTGSTADVLQRASDGKLSYIIDNPFGSALPTQ